MVYSLNYRRPAYVDPAGSNRDSINGTVKQKSVDESISSGTSCLPGGIPEALSFDRIVAGGVCPPCTARDFMNYLKYIEHGAENLQFYLWFRDYCERFERLPASEKALVPEWTSSQAEADAQAAQPTRRNQVGSMVASVLRGTDFGNGIAQPVDMDKRNPFHDSSRTPSSDEKRLQTAISDYGSSFDGDEKTLASSYALSSRADEAFEEAGIKWKPFTAQAFREETTRIVAIYIAVDSPRELNLSDRERTAVLHALQHTTHPSAFKAAVTSAEWSLRRQAHPNFIRWVICNGNGPRVAFARCLGYFTIAVALVADILITLSNAGRAWRIMPIIGYLIGVATLVAAWKGMCVVLHGMHHRHVRPWEMFADEDDPIHRESADTLSQESLASSRINSYEDEPWVAKYEKRNAIRKIFDRQIWVQEPALRQIQDTIFLQSILAGLVASAIIVGIFCAVPHGHYF